MTESQYTSAVVSYLRNAGCFVFKLSDRFTTGVPDVAVTTNGSTTWLEFKDLKPDEDPFDRIQADKAQFMNMLVLAAQGRAFYVTRQMRQVYLIRPQMLISKLSWNQWKMQFYSLVGPVDSNKLKTLLLAGPVILAKNTEYQPILSLCRMERL